MEILYSILLVPIVVGVSLMLNVYGDLFHRSSEQLRLDAYTLSICHQRAHFLQDEIEPANREIRALQSSMDQAAETCEEVEELPEIGQSICAVSMIRIQAQALEGQAIELSQNLLREQYAGASFRSRERLARDNKLDASEGLLRVNPIAWESHALHDGLEREVHSQIRQKREAKFFSKWPKRLQRAINFEPLHTVEVIYRPKRALLGGEQGDFKYQRRLINETGESKTRSTCQVKKNYQVKRIQ